MNTWKKIKLSLSMTPLALYHKALRYTPQDNSRRVHKYAENSQKNLDWFANLLRTVSSDENSQH
jgi:hypothetical protein